MGYIAHEVVIVTTWKSRDYELPDIEAFKATLDPGFPALVIGPIRAVTNGYVTYVFAPDGSKEGWEDSNKGDVYREQFKALFRGHVYPDGSSPVDMIHVVFGEDFRHEAEAPCIVEEFPPRGA